MNQPAEPPLLSVVVPVYNERDSLAVLHAELSEVAAQIAGGVEFLFIDDGSTDGSWQEICRLADADPRVGAVRLRRNFGKSAALSAGFDVARGRKVCTLDADLQDDPREIPRMLDLLDQGFDVVSGWKKTRHDPWHKTIPSKFFNLMVGTLTGVWLHDHNCGLKCYRIEVLSEIKLYGEFHRFIPVLADARGFRIGELAVNHRPRRFGHSKFGITRVLRGFVDLLTVKFLTSYNNRPQHLLGSLGLFCFLAGLLGLCILSVEWLCTHMGWAQFQPLHERPLLLFSALGVLFGAQMLSIGLLAELITARNLEQHHIYSVAEQRRATSTAVTLTTQ